MLGAIAGDIVGSIYEFDPIDHEDFEPLFGEDATFTDDTILTVAVADALVSGRDPVETFKAWGRGFPNAGWGGMFARWLFSDETAPYGSFGNGAAMRVSPAGWIGRDLDEVLALADRVTVVTHDHPDAVDGARAVAEAVYRFRTRATADAVRDAIGRRYGYDLDRTAAQIRPHYDFDETCRGTVPPALVCALEARSTEDAIRKAVSLGGDADTLAAIAGAVAEARFGLPTDLANEALARIPEPVRDVLRRAYARAGAAMPGGTQDADPDPAT